MLPLLNKYHCNAPRLFNPQLTEDGRRGPNGPCATAAVVAASRNARAAAPTPPRSTVAPSVKVKASRSWRVILSAQVTTGNCNNMLGIEGEWHLNDF